MKKNQEILSITLINQTIEELYKENINKNNNQENNDKLSLIIVKVNETLFSLYKKGKGKPFKFKIIKYFKFLETIINNNKRLSMKKHNNVEKDIIVNRSIVNISIILLLDFVNNKKHNFIQKYIKILLVLIINKILKNEYFYLILDIFLKTILYRIDSLNLKTPYKFYKLKNEPLLFINDIIEGIINFPFDILKDDIFVELFTKSFNNFFLLAKRKNIIIEKGVEWLKLLENKEFNLDSQTLKEKEKTIVSDKIIDFLINIYKNNIPINFFGEIYKKSCIDLIYYLNILKLIQKLFEKDYNSFNNENFIIRKGIYLLGNKKYYKNININVNQFSLIFSFKIKKIKKEEDSSFFKLFYLNIKGKTNVITTLINKDQNLVIAINKDAIWNTKIQLEQNKFYLICIIYEKNSKNIKLYINSKNTSNNKLPEKISNNCYKYTSLKILFPNFVDNMNVQLGEDNFYGILGEIILINISLDTKSVEHLFNSSEFYAKLIHINKINLYLMINKIYLSKDLKDAINHFKKLNYECLLRIQPKSLYHKNKFNDNNELFEYILTYSFQQFMNEKGIDFLILMLHVINSQIKEYKTFDFYICKTINFLYNSIVCCQKVKNNYFEINKEEIVKQINLFFLTLLSILKNNNTNKNNFCHLSKDIKSTLLNFLSMKFKTFNYHINIIINILVDDSITSKKEINIDLKEAIIDKLDLSMINKEIIYNIFLMDSIFLLKNIKHKKLFDFFGSLFKSKYNNLFCNELANYIIKIKNEIKIYYYLKLIYYNYDMFKKGLEYHEKFKFYSFLEINFQKLKDKHCKYCSYILILCYLIKNDLINEEGEKNDGSFNFNTYGYMMSPSFLFLRCIFIQTFSLSNNQKFKFIKSKNKNIYNMDYFEYSLQKNPIDLIEDKKTFIKRFADIIKYANFLFNSEKTPKINYLIENFFSFIIGFLNLVNNMKTINQRKDIIIFINKLLDTNEKCNFFIIFLKYNEEKALKTINGYIKSSLYIFFKPLLNLISPSTLIGKVEKSEIIKVEIIKNIIIEIVKKNETKNIELKILFLILIYKNIYEEHITISIDFPKTFYIYYCFLNEKKLFLDRHLLNLIFNQKKNNSNFIEELNEKNENLKFISEIIIDVILRFNEYDRVKDDKILYNILIIDNSSTIFYINDIDNIKNNKDKTLDLNSSPIFKFQMNNFLFILYYLIIFFNKIIVYKNELNMKKKILNILQILFKDLSKIYKDTKKITTIIKKVDVIGINFLLYNKLLAVCNKNYKDTKFTLEYLYKNYLEFKQIKNNKIEDNNRIIIDGLEDIDIHISKKVETTKAERAKSFDKKISQSKREKFLKNINSLNNNFMNIENDILNQSMITDLPINFKDINESNDAISNENSIENESKEDNYLKNELSKINPINFYLEKIINNIATFDDIKMLFNPREYFFWQNFAFAFKDLIYKNKKFMKISKAFAIFIKNNKETFSEKRKEYFLNYPTKLKNYTISDYYRPFLKPYLNFFKNTDIKISHSYIKKNLLINPKYKEDIFSLIEFKRIFIINNEKIVNCERIQNKGNIFGCIKFHKNYLIFENLPENVPYDTKDLNVRLKYIYSSKEESIIDKNKYNIIFYRDIKEIIKRRLYFHYIGYEIFMKDNRSYLFNFFNNENCNLFLKEINNKKEIIKINNSINNIKNEEDKNLKNNNLNMSNFKSNKFDFKIIENPTDAFKKSELKKKYQKGEISNFHYLLLLNKYSSRSYNDNSQYLVFPLLFMNESRTIKRDLSKAICLNKFDDKFETLSKIQSNLKFLGYYFNQHFSTSGYILFFLVRVIPFTYSHIQFQSGKFDLPTRIFSSMKHFLTFINILFDNRELIPEFFYNYEFFINLNYNNLGNFEEDEENYIINNLDTNKKNESYAEFVIYMRNLLENSDISPWIDNIFGIYQLNNSNEHPNSYPSYTYESNCDFEKIKQKNIPLRDKIEELEQSINLLKFGMTPVRLFNKAHPKNISKQNNNDYENDLILFEKKEKKILDMINNYFEKKNKKGEFYLINNNNYEMIEIIFKFDSNIDILKFKLGENKAIETAIPIKGQIQIEPHNNLFCEISGDIYCIVRNIDETIKFIFHNKIIGIFQWTCIITAITPLSQIKKIENKNIKFINKIIIGDEKGFLHIMKIKTILNQNEKYNEIISLKIIKSIKVHNSWIKGIVHNERLNIIISWIDEGIITINNDYSLIFLNIIELGKNYEIKDIIISKYDLLYISCFDLSNNSYKIVSFTLNGIQTTFFENTDKIVNFFVEEKKVIIIHENKNIFICDCYDLSKIRDNIFCDYNDNYRGNKIILKYCSYYPKLKKMLIVYNNNKVNFQDFEKIKID